MSTYLQRNVNAGILRRMAIPAAVAVAGAGVLAVALIGGGASTQAAPSTSSASISASLTAYHGKQSDAFTIDKVPAGWTVQDVTDHDLLLAPANTKNHDVNKFEGKILITLANEAEIATTRADAHPLEVGSVEATRFTFSGPNAPAGLLLPQDKGTVIVQFASKMNWDDAAIADFAAGIHTTGKAVASAG
jgi:hypothetical protein